MKERILITGGAGFIGTHLAKAYSENGYQVTVIDLQGPSELIPNVKYFRGDVRKESDLAGLISTHDAVFHWAAIVSVPDCQKDPVGSYETNTISTLKVLDLIRTENAQRPSDRKIKILFSSSSAVYGESGNSGEPISESNPLPEPISFYGAQKLASEQLIRLYSKAYGIPAVVFRFFNVFGPGQKANSPYSGVISLFTKNVRSDQELRLNGAGAPTRDFISVHDLVRACVAGQKSRNPDVCSGAPINLGSGEAIAIKNLAKMLFEISDKLEKTVDAPARDGDILHSRADISRARTLLDWQPHLQLKDALQELLNS